MKVINREVDPLTGITTTTHYDPDSDTMVVDREQDVEPLLDANKRQYNDAPDIGRWKGEIIEVAKIDPITIEKWLREDPPLNIYKSDPDTRAELRRRLNSPEYRYLRTMPGKI